MFTLFADETVRSIHCKQVLLTEKGEKILHLNILCLDLEDWYLSYDSSQIKSENWTLLESRVEKNCGIFLEMLKRQGQKATFFVLGWIALKHPSLIKEIATAGHEIGYHSFAHALPVNQGPKAFESDLVQGLELLESITGKKTKYYRAPMFSLCKESAWVIPILIKHGIETSSSFKSYKPFNGHSIPDRPFYFEYQGNRLLELPLNRVWLPGMKLVYSGSGYFRLLPLWIIRFLFEHQSYNMSYFHPRDFDKQVPYTGMLPAYRNWMNRYGNAHTLHKLEVMLNEFDFFSIGEATEQLKMKSLQIVKIE